MQTMNGYTAHIHDQAHCVCARKCGQEKRMVMPEEDCIMHGCDKRDLMCRPETTHHRPYIHTYIIHRHIYVRQTTSKSLLQVERVGLNKLDELSHIYVDVVSAYNKTSK